MQRKELEAYLDRYLDVAKFRDASPNGLQVEGRANIERIVTGVTASLELLEAAIAARADAIIVHHGYFWRGEDSRLIGARRRRIATLIENDVNLFGFHLPLDAHLEVGNNVTLAKRLGFNVRGQFGEQNIGFHGDLDTELTLRELAKRVEERLDRKPLVVGDESRTVRRVAWCTGAAQSWFDQALEVGVDAYVTGEVSEHTVHTARENAVAFISAGHHATERYGVQALGEHLARTFALTHQFIDIPNPV